MLLLLLLVIVQGNNWHISSILDCICTNVYVDKTFWTSHNDNFCQDFHVCTIYSVIWPIIFKVTLEWDFFFFLMNLYFLVWVWIDWALTFSLVKCASTCLKVMYLSYLFSFFFSTVFDTGSHCYCVVNRLCATVSASYSFTGRM